MPPQKRRLGRVIVTRVIRLVDVSLSSAQPVAAEPEAVRDTWRLRSTQAAWLRPHDWYTPEVEAVSEFVAAGDDPVPALEALGRARAEAGVGLPETLADVRCLVETSPCSLDAWNAASSAAQGWADGAAMAASPAPIMDPVTDLATMPYLVVRLREVYAQAAADGKCVSKTHALLIAETAVTCPDPWQRLRRGAILGDVLRRVFSAGEPPISLGSCSGAAIILVARGPLLGAQIHKLRRQLERDLEPLQRQLAARHPVRLWVEALPTSYQSARHLLTDLAR